LDAGNLACECPFGWILSAIDGSAVNTPEMTHEMFQLGLSRYSYICEGHLLVARESILEVDFNAVSGDQLECSLSQKVGDMFANDLESI
jgi:hypothetical protein